MRRDAGHTDRSLRIGMREGVLYVLLPMLLVCAAGTRTLGGVLGGGLLNPDSYMRLVRLEDAVRQHGIAYLVARDDAGQGTLLHWSHLLDALLWLMAAPLRLVLDPPTVLHAAAVAFGPLGIGALGLALAWLVAPVTEPRWRWLAPVAAALSTPIVAYGVPGVVHHHVPLLLVAVMTAGYALRGVMGLASPRAGLAMGAWGGIGIWLSPESMPFTLMAFGALWLAWAAEARRDLVPMMTQAGIGFLAVVAAAFLLDPPYAGYLSLEIDRVSLVYVALALAVVVMAGAARGMTGSGHIALRLLIPVVCLGAWVALFPALLRGTGGLMTAQQTQAMFGGITEMMPVRTASEAVALLLTGAVTAGALAWLALARRSLLLGYAGLCAAILVVFGAVHIRFGAYSATAAAAMLSILVTRANVSLADWPEAARAGIRLALMAVFVLAPRAEGLPGLFPSATAAATDAAPGCALSGAAPLLAAHAGQVVLSDPSSSPELLYRTDVLTVGSLYHRNVAAFMRLRAAWRSAPSEGVPDEVRATGASLLLVCPTRGRSMLVADLPPDTLLDRLNQGRVPAWLRPIGADPGSGHVLYEVMR